MLLGVDGAGEPKQGCGVREESDYIGAQYDFLVDLFHGIGGPCLALVPGWEAGEREFVVPGFAEHCRDFGMGFDQGPEDFIEPGLHVFGVGLGEGGGDD